MAEPDDTLIRLASKLESARKILTRYDEYLEGKQPIKFLAPALQKEFGERITELVVNFPEMVTSAFEERLDVEGFRYAGNSSGDEGLWKVWQANDLDEQSQQAHYDAIGLSRSYVIVGSPDGADEPPVVTVESPLQVFAERDPRTRRVTAAIKRWDEGEGKRKNREQHAVLYLPDSTRHKVNKGGEGWQTVGDVDQHDVGRVLVVPLVNKPRILRPDGRSELHDVIPLADAINKMATDMMVSGEYHSMPRRWAAGMKQSDFQDETGRQLNAWSRDAGTLWATENKDAKFGQFTESDLKVFHDTIKLLAQLVTQLAGLPPHYASFASGDQNPTSADAIRSSESRLVKRAERKQTYLGGGWEEVMRLVLRIQTGTFDPKARALETIWRDPSTPTVAQKADAAVKLATPLTPGGPAIVPIEMTREDLGYTPEQRRRMTEMDRAAQTDPYLATLAAKEAAAQQQQVTGAGPSAPARG